MNNNRHQKQPNNIARTISNKGPRIIRPFIPDESVRATAGKAYWNALRSINAGEGIQEAICTLMNLAVDQSLGSLSVWARESLLRKFGCTLNIA